MLTPVLEMRHSILVGLQGNLKTSTPFYVNEEPEVDEFNMQVYGRLYFWRGLLTETSFLSKKAEAWAK